MARQAHARAGREVRELSTKWIQKSIRSSAVFIVNDDLL